MSKEEKAIRFVEHIEHHLTDKFGRGFAKVMCKICEKTIDEIWDEQYVKCMDCPECSQLPCEKCWAPKHKYKPGCSYCEECREEHDIENNIENNIENIMKKEMLE